VPTLRWVDCTGTHPDTGQPYGVTLLNDNKHGCRVHGGEIIMSLLRSSYDPDPLPEMGPTTATFALLPHDPAWSAADATRAATDFNLPIEVVGTTNHPGSLPPTQGFAECLTPNILVSGLKPAEDGEALIIRLYECDGRATTAQVRLADILAAPDAPAVETDVLEVPTAHSTARMAEGVLSVDVPAYGLATVRVG
jgi:alpha-mannosidase